uniref:C2H2-type domain-containing protein n=1 Tax=viral metagenome TaxID=1070528 RepID=A0A6C0B7P5_9ZZZZ
MLEALDENDNKIFKCECCDYNTSKKNNLTKHFASQKHIIIKRYFDFQNEVATAKSQCVCGKTYKHRQSLHTHRKTCPVVQKKDTAFVESKESDLNLSSDILVEIIRQNKELQNVLLEQNNKMLEMSKIQPVVINNTTNNQFNLQVFLNEQCKDALNIMDFVNSLQLQVKDFETTGRLGFVEGISRIIVNGLKQIDVHKRPIHCTDVKRETLYIKDHDLWSKANPDKNKLKQAVNMVAQKNLRQLPKWQEENPDCTNINAKENETYLQLSLAALGGRTPEEDAKYMDKIVRNVLKEVVIDKSSLIVNS